MTDEEKAEEYINKNPRAKILYCFEADRIKQVKKALLYGLKEGRKENILKECANDCKIPEGCDVFVRYEIVEERNAELKKDKEYLDKVNNEQTEVILKLNEQIEKMKCCENCNEPCWNPPIVRRFECIYNNHSLWESLWGLAK